MRILFQNRKKSLWNGGDYVQLEKTAEALRKLGHEIDIRDEYIVPPEVIQAYDIVHLWNFSMIWTKFQLWLARKYKKPVVCSMIYHESEEFIEYHLQQIMMDELSCAIFQTKGERERAKRHLKFKNNKTKIVPNAIDKWWLDVSDKSIKMEEYVLTVGRIEPNKGQLAVARVCNKLKTTYVIIGEVTDKEYAKQCEDLGAVILPHMPPEKLKPYYYSAKVYIQPSAAETWGLCIDEAASQGTPCILTNMCERDDYYFIHCEHDNDQSIEEAILEAWEIPKDFTHARQLKTWDDIAKQISKIYERIIPTKTN